MFKQEIKDGYQIEVPDNWLKDGNPFEIKRDEYRYEVKFGGYVRSYRDERPAEICLYRKITVLSLQYRMTFR